MISIFVSSTFSDMQAERDVLRQRVLPRLQKFASVYGESLRMVDLRWGVDTTSMSEEQATKKIMGVCFEQIDKCEGKMICLVGNRYGWVPNYDIKEMANRFSLTLNSNISATELEIQYGIFQRKNPHKATVFLRDEIKSLPEELHESFYDDNPRLDILKSELINNKSCLCRHYSLEYSNGFFSGLDTFEEIAYSSLQDYIVAQCDIDTIAPHIKIKNQFDSYIENETIGYYSFSELDAEACLFVNSNNTFSVLKANPGMGKSAFSAHICKCWGSNRKIFYYFCGYNSETETPMQMLRYFICEISDYLGINVSKKTNTIQENRQIFSYLIDKIEEDVLFIIDGIDHFVCPYEERLSWLPAIVSDSVKFIFTTSSQDKSYEKLNEHSDIVFLSIPPLNTSSVFIKHLLQTNGKNIQDKILMSSLKEHQIDTYYHAKMVADALMMMDQYDFQSIKEYGNDINAINNFIHNSLSQLPKTINGLATFLLHDYGKRIAPELVPEVFIYIVCNEGGLRATDLEAILKSNWNELSFERYISFLSGIIIVKEDGCYDFSSSLIRNAVEKLVKWKHKKRVVRHIETLPNNDPLKIRCCLNRSLFYEHYDVVFDLITSNLSSVIIADQFIGCLNYMVDEITSLLKRYDLQEWFFDNIIPRTTSIQEEDACAKIVSNTIMSVSSSIKPRALEFLGDYYKQKSDFLNAEQYYRATLKSLLDGENCSIGRLYYKLAAVMCVNSEMEFETLRESLTLSINSYKKETQLDVINRMYSVVAQYQLIIAELNHSINGILDIQVFNIEEMRIKDGLDDPYLSFISKSEIQEIKEETGTSITLTIDLFNKYRREAEQIYTEAYNNRDIESIIDLFILTLNGFDIFGIPEGKVIRLKEIKEDIEGSLSEQFSIGLYKTLGMLEYELSLYSDQRQEKKQHLKKCCAIWGQFINQLSLPNFTKEYINAERKLVELYLDENNENAVNYHLAKWSQARYDYIINDLRQCSKQCKRYPDEIHFAILQKVREETGSLNGEKLLIKKLKEKYNRCSDIAEKCFYYIIRFYVFKDLDIFKDREDFSYVNYYWLKTIYVEFSKNDLLKSGDIETDEHGLICICLLKLMLQMLDIISDIEDHKNELKAYDIKEYYGERIFVLEERHKYEMLRLEKISFGYLYAKSLIDQAKSDVQLLEQNCLFAVKILNTIRRLLYENEVTPFDLSSPMISQGRINFDLCAVEIMLASYYSETGLILSAAKTYESVTALALSLVGVEESDAADHLYLKIASVSCAHSFEYYRILNNKQKIYELSEKIEIIKTLSNQ